MRIKLDENLPTNIAFQLMSRGHDVHTVEQERLLGYSDNAIWSAAQQEQRFLITQDLDFLGSAPVYSWRTSWNPPHPSGFTKQTPALAANSGNLRC